jgi:hypothetical protein
VNLSAFRFYGDLLSYSVVQFSLGFASLAIGFYAWLTPTDLGLRCATPLAFMTDCCQLPTAYCQLLLGSVALRLLLIRKSYNK